MCGKFCWGTILRGKQLLSKHSSRRLLEEVHSQYSFSRAQCFEWFQLFRSGDFDIRDQQRPGQVKKFGDEELEFLLDQDLSQMLEEHAQSLGVAHQAVSKR